MKTGLLLVPFVFFLVGFYGASLLVRQSPFPAPSLVGLPVVDAIAVLSERELNVRIRAQQERADLIPGTVIEQTPRPGQQVKPHQSVFLVVVRQPKKATMPSFMGSTVAEAQQRAEEIRLKVKVWRIADIAPRDTVIAQWPHPGKELEGRQAVLYVSTGSKAFVRIVPDFRGMGLKEVVNYLAQDGIKTVQTVTGAGTFITAQKPLPGSLVDLSKPLSVQLQA
ncbi:MAG: Serine/threonine protein kinase with PASTA sensor(S) [candidate division TM6 bacterium GW2011_GWE2_42_60]|nr:MAG: Serine/threonine protein kinase with PASTA sensor(S) [candidate division TM6 bacterium GW2011_GWE2_42_60]HBY05625.1 hypothetical protein [Candidatus Dependentiae bacterium]